MVAPDLIGIDVEVHQLLAGLQPHALEARSHCEHDVGGVEHRTEATVHPHRAHRQRVPVVDRALAFARRDHRRLERFRDRDERGRRVAEHDATTGDDQRRGRRREQRGGLLQRGLRRRDAGHRDRRDDIGVRRVAERLGRDLDLHRAGPAGGHLPERSAHRAGDLTGVEHALRPLRDRAHEIELVVHVVQQPEVVADPGAVHLAREQQHRRRARVGSREARPAL